MVILHASTRQACTECLLRARYHPQTEDIWDGDRLVPVPRGQQDKTIAVCGDGGRLRYVAAIWDTEAAEKVALMYLEGESRNLMSFLESSGKAKGWELLPGPQPPPPQLPWVSEDPALSEGNALPPPYGRCCEPVTVRNGSLEVGRNSKVMTTRPSVESLCLQDLMGL